MNNLLLLIFKVSSYECQTLKASGFTLVELIVTIAILSVIATIALPAFNENLRIYEAKRVSQDFESAVKRARAESLIHHNHVLLCLSDNSLRCDRQAQDQLLMFIDANHNNAYDAGIDSLLESLDLKLKYGQVNLSIGLHRDYIKFFPDTGMPRGHMGRMNYCSNSDKSSDNYHISVNKNGQTSYRPYPHQNQDCS